MAKSKIINVLDIGTNSIKFLSAVKKPGENVFDVLFQHQERSLGVRNGVVIDAPKVSEIISSIIKRAEEETGNKVDGVYANVGGGHVFCNYSRGLVSVSRADRKISEEDIDRVIQNARAVSLPSDKKNNEVLDIFPKEFIIDGEGGVKEAVGMEGTRLEADVLVLCGFSPYVKNSTQTILDSGVSINYLFTAPLVSSRSVLTAREKELGVCVLDIGAGTTGMSVFEGGDLIHTAIFPVGSSHITNDIAICLQTDIDTAEKIKLEFGSCKKTTKSKKKKIKIEGEEPLEFSQKELEEIIEARVSEVFDFVSKELKKISKQELLPAGIVLTGGGSMLPGIKEMAKKKLKLPCRLGVPKSTEHENQEARFTSIQEDPSLAAIYGMVLEGAEMEEENGSPREVTKKIKKFFRTFIP